MLLVRSYNRQVRTAAACGSSAQPSDERSQNRGSLRRLRALLQFGCHAGASALGGADSVSDAVLRVDFVHRRLDRDAERSRHGARHPGAPGELTGLFRPNRVRDLTVGGSSDLRRPARFLQRGPLCYAGTHGFQQAIDRTRIRRFEKSAAVHSENPAALSPPTASRVPFCGWRYEAFPSV